MTLRCPLLFGGGSAAILKGGGVRGLHSGGLCLLVPLFPLEDSTGSIQGSFRGFSFLFPFPSFSEEMEIWRGSTNG